MPWDPRRSRTLAVVFAALLTALPGGIVLHPQPTVDRPAGSGPAVSETARAAEGGIVDAAGSRSVGAPATAAPVGVPVDGPIGSGVVGTGGYPDGAAYDPDNQELYIANHDDNNTTVVNATTGAHVTDIAMPSDPVGVVYVPQDREVYVILEMARLVEVVNTSTNALASNISLAGDPEYEAYDPTDQALFLSLWTPNGLPMGVAEVFTSNDTPGPILTRGFDGPWGLALDPVTDTIWVANLDNDTVTVLSAATDTVVRSLSPGPQPNGGALVEGIAYSPVREQMFLGNAATTSTLNALGASNYTLIASGIPVGSGTFGGASITYDPANECVYVASYDANSVSVISALSDSSAHPILTIGGGPWAGVYDPTTGALFFVKAASGGAEWIFGGISVNFEETGLPGADVWTVGMNGTSRIGSASLLSFVEPVGPANYTVSGPLPFVANRTRGTVNVPSVPLAPVSIALRFNYTYPVQFLEEGLPSGSPWTVNVSGAGGAGGVSADIAFREPNGSYPYRVTTSVAGYEPTENATGNLDIVGGSAFVNVTFDATYL